MYVRVTIMIALTNSTLERYFLYRGYKELPHDGLYRCFLDPASGAKFWMYNNRVRVGPTIGEAVEFTEEVRIGVEAWLAMQEIMASVPKRRKVPQQFYDWIDVREGRRTMAEVLGWPNAPAYYDHYLERTEREDSNSSAE